MCLVLINCPCIKIISCINLISSSKQPHEMDIILFPIFQIRKLSLPPGD